MIMCNVWHCPNYAESDIEGYPVCLFHDSVETRNVLMELRRPGAYRYLERSVVVACGDLQESDFDPRPV